MIKAAKLFSWLFLAVIVGLAFGVIVFMGNAVVDGKDMEKMCADEGYETIGIGHIEDGFYCKIIDGREIKEIYYTNEELEEWSNNNCGHIC